MKRIILLTFLPLAVKAATDLVDYNYFNNNEFNCNMDVLLPNGCDPVNWQIVVTFDLEITTFHVSYYCYIKHVTQ